LFQQKVNITEQTTAGDLHDELMKVGASLILKTVKAIESGSVNLEKQNDSQAIHAPKIFKETCKINWNKPVNEVYNLIRGLSPYPGAFTEFKDVQGNSLSLKIISSVKDISEHSLTNGSLLTDNKTYANIACDGGYICVKELQLQGKKKMTTAEFLRGYKFPENTIFF